MREQKVFQFLLILGTALCMLGTLLFFKREMMPASAADPKIQVHRAGPLAQNTYMGPTHKIPGNPYLVRIEVLVRDSPDLGGVQIQSVSFDGNEIPLKPRDIHGKRASASFQLPPGKYKLRWTVRRDKVLWPRTFTHEEDVNVNPRDLWVQISIDGETASIS